MRHLKCSKCGKVFCRWNDKITHACAFVFAVIITGVLFAGLKLEQMKR